MKVLEKLAAFRLERLVQACKACRRDKENSPLEICVRAKFLTLLADSKACLTRRITSQQQGVEKLPNLSSIRDVVLEELCRMHQLLPNAFPMTEECLVRQGSPCGVFYCLHGPRSVRLTAVLDFASARVLFYDSTGQRSGMRCVKDLIPAA